jgi:hypothetical protein
MKLMCHCRMAGKNTNPNYTNHLNFLWDRQTFHVCAFSLASTSFPKGYLLFPDPFFRSISSSNSSSSHCSFSCSFSCSSNCSFNSSTSPTMDYTINGLQTRKLNQDHRLLAEIKDIFEDNEPTIRNTLIAMVLSAGFVGIMWYCIKNAQAVVHHNQQPEVKEPDDQNHVENLAQITADSSPAPSRDDVDRHDWRIASSSSLYPPTYRERFGGRLERGRRRRYREMW